MTKPRHGHALAGAETSTYRTWLQMRQRCQTPTNRHFAQYGGRGISVCERWQRFDAFLADMGERPAGLELDRIDNDAGYSPENCRWVTRREQVNNRRNTCFVEYAGRRLAVADLARELGVTYKALTYRVRNDWPQDQWANPPGRTNSVRRVGPRPFSVSSSPDR